jgi:hypothetical protein
LVMYSDNDVVKAPVNIEPMAVTNRDRACARDRNAGGV